jgi:nucleolar protein 16
MSQNYKRLGLSSRLNAATGGVEQRAHKKEDTQLDGTSQNSLSIPSEKYTRQLVPQETRVERDPHTGHILRIIRPENGNKKDQDNRAYKPLDDPLNDLDKDEEISTNLPKNSVVAELEAQAAEEAIQLAKTKRPRQQSQRECEWVESLVKRHGDNIMAMVRDQKLNSMQQSEGDIRRRIKIWNATRKSDDIV